MLYYLKFINFLCSDIKSRRLMILTVKIIIEILCIHVLLLEFYIFIFITCLNARLADVVTINQ